MNNFFKDAGGFLEPVITIACCNGDGFLYTFNTKANTDEIQKCDNCNKFATDKEAKAHA